MTRTRLSKEQALQKLRHYCAYQERCHAEVRDKAYTFGMYKNEVEELLSMLIQDDYLNEERFAIQYAGSKFRMNQWGRVKIRHALQQKQISRYCIDKALRQIPADDYQATLEKLATAKRAGLRSGTHPLARKQQLQSYLLQKGFEAELVRVVLDDV